MAKQTNIYSPVGFNTAGVVFNAADTTTTKLIIAAGSNDSLLRQFSVANTSANVAVMNVYLYNGTTDYLLGAVSVLPNAGFDGSTPAVNLLDILGMVFNAAIPLKQGWSVRAAAQATLTGNVVFTAVTADY